MQHKFTRQELYELVWSEPVKDLAKKFELSDTAVAKSCKKSNIPRPPRGYWAKIAAGKTVKQIPLQKRGPGMSDEVTVGGGRYGWYRSISDEELLQLAPQPPEFTEPIEKTEAEAKALIKEAPIPPFPSHAHHKIRRLLEADEVWRQKRLSDSFMFSWEGPYFDEPIEQRRLTIINAIMTALERAGMSPGIGEKDGRRLFVEINDTTVFYTVDATSQKLDRNRRNAIETRGSSTKLKCCIHAGGPESAAEYTWEDKGGSKLEKQVLKIVRALIVTGEVHYRRHTLSQHQHLLECKERLIERIAREKAEAEQRERERIAALEQARLDRLTSDAAAFRQAQDIKAFIADVSARYRKGEVPVSEEGLARWEAWALAQAERIDPIHSGTFISSIEDVEDTAGNIE